jgi:hypothetical protein
MAQKGGKGIALLFQDLGATKGGVVSIPPRPLFTPGTDLVPIVQEAGGPQGQSGRAENLAIGIRTPVRPARSQSLYRLSYPAYIPTNVNK